MYDTIIIGAGLSGLAAGIRLAYFGKKVCVLERHTTIGGLNSFYRLRRRDYDVGLHAVTNFAAPGTKSGPLSSLLRQLRLRWEDFSLAPQVESRVAFPDVSLRFNNDFELLAAEVAEKFPGEGDRFRKLAQIVSEHDERNLSYEPRWARPVLEETLRDPLLIEMLYCPLMFYGSATAHDMDWNQFVVMFKAIFQQGFGRPWEGVRLIMRNIVRKFREVGGELKLRSGVQEIRNDGHQAHEVVLDNGEVLTGKNILSSAGYVETLKLCGLENDPSAKPGEITFLESISVLDQQPAEMGHKETIVFFNHAPKFHYEPATDPVDLRSGIICSPNNFQYDQPLEEGVLRITAIASGPYWMGLEEPEYIEQKTLWHQRMLESARGLIPDIKGHVIDTDVFTPRTIKKFTGHLNGCVYGAPEKRMTGVTPLENVFICGTDQGYLGIVGSLLSGITIANLHLLK
ncbi:MAG: FAD-dependent oxidoreductase [Planctomycetales bacterium]